MRNEQRRPNRRVGSDLHCHILPGVDDGAKNLAEAEALLRRQCDQGIRQIMFTPHFYARHTTLDEFLLKRLESAAGIVPLCEQLGISGGLGAEVRMELELLDLNLGRLALADSGYLLLEWPFTTYPLWGEEVVRRVFETGNRPIFAHIERYDFFFYAPERLADFIASGVLCQMNASTLLESGTQRQALRLIQEGYIHVLSSDAHNMEKRPPQLGQAFQIVEEQLGVRTADRLRKNADDVFCGRAVHAVVPAAKKKFSLFGKER